MCVYVCVCEREEEERENRFETIRRKEASWRDERTQDGGNFHLDAARLKIGKATEAAFIKRSSLIRGSSRSERIVAKRRRFTGAD